MSADTRRRDVLIRLAKAGAALGAAGLAGGLGTLSPGRRREAEPAAPPRRLEAPADGNGVPLAVARGGTPGAMVRAVVSAMGGMSRFVRRGETVLVKPNMAWDRPPDLGANTHPEVVAEVVRLCVQAGAGRVLVGDVPVHDASRVTERSGIGPAARQAGAELIVPPAAGFVLTRIGGAVLDAWEVFRPVLEADRIINVPVVKDHALTRLTCGLKNAYGFLGGTRARLHQQIHPAIADLAITFRPALTIVDATRVMTRGGPTGGRAEDVRPEWAVAAGTDAVALDAWGARLLGIDPADIPYLVLAEGRGVGSIRNGLGRLEEIRVGA